MRTSFVIYFLFTTMIGNVLHAAEESFGSQDSTNLILTGLEAGPRTGSGVEPADLETGSEVELKTFLDESNQNPPRVNDGIISSLDALNALVNSEIESKQTRGRKSIDKDKFLKIPDDIIEKGNKRIHPDVFKTYVNKEIKKDPEIGWYNRLRRTLWCKEFYCKRQDPFKHKFYYAPYEYKGWSKSLVTIAVCKRAQSINQSAATRAGGRLRDIDGDDEVRNLQLNVFKKSLIVEGLTKEKELNKTLRTFIENHAEEEAKYDKFKEILFIIATVAGVYTATAFGYG